MHVLLASIKIDSQFAGSGISRAVQARCRMLVEAGHQATVLASFEDATPAPPCPDVDLVHVPLRRRAPQAVPALNDVLHGRALGRAASSMLSKGGIDLVDVQEANIVPGLAPHAARFGVPLVHSIHLSALYGQPRFGAIRQRVLAALNVRAARQARRCIAVSQCVKDAYVKARIAPSRISVVYNPVASAGPRSARDVPQLPEVLWLSRMVDGKGVDEAVDCALHVPEARFTFVGGGELEDLVYLAAQSATGRIRAEGVVRDPGRLAELRSRADVFLATSRHETFGMAVAEAMAAGLPVLATDIAAHREVLAGTGVLYHAGNTTVLVEALRSLLENAEYRAELSEAARCRAEAVFGWAPVRDALIAAYGCAIGADGTAKP